MYLEQN